MEAQCAGEGVGRAAGGVDLKQIMMEQSTLSVKGKDPIHPSDVQIGRQGPALEAYLLFPRTTAFNVDDKEVELTSKIQRMTIRNKFRLKDMMFNNKLEL